jgi:hypothetical protein
MRGGTAYRSGDLYAEILLDCIRKLQQREPEAMRLAMEKVSREPQQTIFPLDARKTYEFSPLTGYAFVRYVNRTVPRMQIVQRQESGWVNWGTNGENEVPEVPSGSTIISAYGRFANLEEEAARMETPVVAAPGIIERFYPL